MSEHLFPQEYSNCVSLLRSKRANVEFNDERCFLADKLAVEIIFGHNEV